MAELSYRRHRFPPVVIQHAVWLYLRFTLSYRDVEDLLAERELDISYETIRSWVLKFGPVIARRLRRRRPRPTDRWHLDEMVVRIAGERLCLWRAVDHEGEVLNMLVQRRRNTRSARRRIIGKTPLRQDDRRFALYLFRPRQLNVTMPCGELRCSWPKIRFLRLSRAAERLHWNNLNADGPALGTGSCGGLGRVNSGHA